MNNKYFNLSHILQVSIYNDVLTIYKFRAIL